MEISRREHGRSFNLGPSRLDIRRGGPRYSHSEPPINYNNWNSRYSPVDSDFQPDFSHRSQRGPHPYQRNHHAQRPQHSNPDTSKIPSLLTLETIPQPMFPPENVQRLRANFRNTIRRSELDPYDSPSITTHDVYDSPPAALTHDPYDTNIVVRNDLYDGPSTAGHDSYDSPPTIEHEPYDSPPVIEEPLNDEDYLREEQRTKQQIEEIIAVAQALREKLDREEELRRQTEQIPKLMDLKPKIPSLMDLHVEPPIEEICWHCDRLGHRFTSCTMPKLRKFCYRCGEPGFDVASCPYCKASR